jgi:hypothetical protein
MNHEQISGSKVGKRSRLPLVLIIILAIIALLLLTGHRAHMFGILPYLLLLACPLIHLFMHRGHGGGGGNHH